LSNQSSRTYPFDATSLPARLLFTFFYCDHVITAKKPICLIVESIQTRQTFLWIASAGILSLNHKEKHNNNHQQVDYCFVFFFLSGNPYHPLLSW